MKKIIVVALPAEARPLIEFYALSRAETHGRMAVYRNAEIALVVSGVGKTYSAVATAFLLGQVRKAEENILLNVGICGSCDPSKKIGALFLANKISDASTGKAYYPDLIVSHGIEEASLITFEKPVTRQTALIGHTGLVDMEAAGFYAAAATFVSPHRIVCLKVVSDHLQATPLEPASVTSLIYEKMESIHQVICRYAVLDGLEKNVLDAADYEVLDRLRTQTRLTTTQYYQVADWLKAYKVRASGSVAVLNPFLEAPVSTKRERKMTIERLRTILLAE